MRRARSATSIVAVLWLLPLSSCTGLWRSTARAVDRAPNGLSRPDDALRRVLTAGSYADAFSRTQSAKRGAPTDALLRAMYRGQTGYYAGRYAESAHAFAEADRLAERRVTKSLSRGAAALLSNDLALPYVPSRTERLFLRYYGMMAYARAGDGEAAAVEARRLGRALEEQSVDLDDGERTLHAVMRDAAGAVFESAGEENDALVSYRNAGLLRGMSRADVDTIRLVSGSPDSTTVVLFVESGFVAHRVDRTIAFGLDESDVYDGAPGPRRTRRALTPTIGAVPVPTTFGNTPTEPVKPINDTAAAPFPTGATVTRAVAAAVVAGSTPELRTPESLASRVDRWLNAQPDGGLFAADDADTQNAWTSGRTLRAGRLDASQWLRMSWPALVRSVMPSSQVAIELSAIPLAIVNAATRTSSPNESTAGIHGLVSERVSPAADVSRAVASDLRRARPAMLSRMVARAAARTVLVEALDDKHEWIGAMVGFASRGMERADTRSWQLLPGSLQVIRLRVPAGDYQPVVRVGEGLERIAVRLAPVAAKAGRLAVLDTRVWRDASAMVAATP